MGQDDHHHDQGTRREDLRRLLVLRSAELADARAEAKRLQEELAQAERAGDLTRLVRGLAHELNNPLAVILGHAQRLPRKLDDHDEVRRRLGIIGQEVQRCIDLVERLRRYAAPLNEGLSACALPGLVVRAGERLRRRGRQALPVAFASEAPLVQAGPRALTKVVEEILDNAASAGARQVVVAIEMDQGRIRLHFDNDGRTPSDEEIANALKPFYSMFTDLGGDLSDPGHAGLGFSLAHALLREMSGSIHLGRRPGQPGARCTVELPGAAPVDGNTRSTGMIPALRLPVLIVDDEPMVAEIVRDAIEETGSQSITANRVTEALAILSARPVAAVLADVHLPDGDGVDLLRQARRLHPGLSGHLALITGDPNNEALRATAASLHCPILGKPFRYQHLVELLEQVLG